MLEDRLLAMATAAVINFFWLSWWDALFAGATIVCLGIGFSATQAWNLPRWAAVVVVAIPTWQRRGMHGHGTSDTRPVARRPRPGRA
jgi:hypothetical protein